MKSTDLFERLKPVETTSSFAVFGKNGLDFNYSGMFSKLIKDAARCNHYNSDIFYDLKHIESRLKEFNPEEEFEPIWIGFRKMGVDGTEFVIRRCEDQNCYGSLSNNYFALYSFIVYPNGENYYTAALNEYAV